MNPPPSVPHQRRSGRLYRLLGDASAAAEAGVEVLEAVGIRFGEQVLIPDLVVTDAVAAAEAGQWLAAEDVLLAAENVRGGVRPGGAGLSDRR